MTGDVLLDQFVLSPAYDLQARSALLFYATEIQHRNPALATYLRAWIAKLNEGESQARRAAGKTEDIPAWLQEQEGRKPAQAVIVGKGTKR